MKIHYDNRTSIRDSRVASILTDAADLVFGSVQRPPRKVEVIVKRLHPSSKNANPTGRAWCADNKVVLRIAEESRRYPDVFEQSRHREWPHIEIRNAGEALFIVACHEFAHIALHCARYGSARQYTKYPNFEEWLCESIATNCLTIRRGIVKSSLL